ncbi:MAG: nucleotide exchange factor GrpE [Bacteroidales bacterium]|nr:nucleotide exchange factor GrpE [Bacteroidales bacterium]
MTKTQNEPDKTSAEHIDTDTAAASTAAEADNQPQSVEDIDNQPETSSAADSFEKQYEEMKDKYLRLSAEFDNYRKRTLREKADMLKYAAEDTLRDMLPVIDDLDRAMQAVESATDIDSLKQGIALITNKFHEFIKGKGVRVIECIGQPLDTDLHEAISKIPAPDEAQKGKIIDVVQKGYTLNEKVMRFAKVVVGE